MTDRYVYLVSKSFPGKHKVLAQLGAWLWIVRVDSAAEENPFTVHEKRVKDFKPEPPVKVGDLLNHKLLGSVKQVKVIAVKDFLFRYLYTEHLERDLIPTYSAWLDRIGVDFTPVKEQDSDD